VGSVLNCLCATEELLHKRYNRNIIVTLLLTVRRTLRAAIDDRAFPVAAAQLWNQRIYKLLKLFCLEQPVQHVTSSSSKQLYVAWPIFLPMGLASFTSTQLAPVKAVAYSVRCCVRTCT